MPDQPDELQGPAVFGYLGTSEADRVPEEERDRLAEALRRALAAA